MVRFGKSPSLAVLAFVLATAMRMAPADEPTKPESAPEVIDKGPIEEAIRQVIIDELKEKYEEKDDWGHTTGMINSVKVKGKWFKPRVEKTTKPVKNGLWQRYIVTPVDPEKNLHLRIDTPRLNDNGRIALSLLVEARLHGEGHIERWRLGTKMLNVSAEAEAVVEAKVDCDVGIRFEKGKLLGGVVLDPRVTAIDLRLVDLDVQRVSHLGGDGVHELGDSLTPLVAKELDRREAKIVAKANKSIDKRRDKLRFSLDEFLKSGWSKFQTGLAGQTPTTAAAPAAPKK